MKPHSLITQRAVTFFCILSAVCFARMHARAGFVDFETVPGIGVPAEGTIINLQYAPSEGMSFGITGGALLWIAQVGSPGYAFTGIGGVDDTPAAGQGVGNFFLSGNTPLQAATTVFVVYSSPVMSAGGVVLDIDGAESWLVTAIDTSSTVIDSVTLNTASFNAGDGLATPWSFSHATADIARVAFIYTGSLSGGQGYAFDNFTSAVPEPSVGVIAALGGLILIRLKFRARV
jgi:hypothetical protein